MRQVADNSPDHAAPQAANCEADETNDLALTCAIGAAVRHSIAGGRLGVAERDEITEAVTTQLLAPPGLAAFDRRLINHDTVWEKARTIDTLLEAAKLFHRANEEHHVEHALDMAIEQLCALRRELWGEDMAP